VRWRSPPLSPKLLHTHKMERQARRSGLSAKTAVRVVQRCPIATVTYACGGPGSRCPEAWFERRLLLLVASVCLTGSRRVSALPMEHPATHYREKLPFFNRKWKKLGPRGKDHGVTVQV
jgi:hypothetical protein